MNKRSVVMQYNSKAIAGYIMYYCDEKKAANPGYHYNNTKIQKLLFVVYGTLLAKFESVMLDESPKMWPYGPVFPSVFKEFKKGGIESRGVSFDGCEKHKEYIDMAIEFFGKYSAKALSDWSHEPNSPWARTQEDNEGAWNTEINDKDIKEYFTGIMSVDE
ncbi:MAG: SocA family protein [Proteobacteria bacterium]|nr:SocA family protein [Pseudomonadota bacterium]